MTQFTFDSIDQTYLDVVVILRDAIDEPRQGDYVRFSTGELERICNDSSFSLQTAPIWAGSFFLYGSGHANFSGSLHPPIPKDSLTLTDEAKSGDFWFFHHNQVDPGRGVRFSIDCRVYDTTAPYKGYLTRR